MARAYSKMTVPPFIGFVKDQAGRHENAHCSFQKKKNVLTKNENNQFTKYSVHVVTLHELIKPMRDEHVP